MDIVPVISAAIIIIKPFTGYPISYAINVCRGSTNIKLNITALNTDAISPYALFFIKPEIIITPSIYCLLYTSLGRDWLLIKNKDQRDEFRKFIEGKTDFILKPIDGTHGDGVAKLPAEMTSSIQT